MVIVCAPTGRLMFIGVSFPVAAPSTMTAAPDGKELILSDPFCALAGSVVSASTAKIATSCDDVFIR